MTVRMKKCVSFQPLKLAKHWIASVKWWIRVSVVISILNIWKTLWYIWQKKNAISCHAIRKYQTILKTPIK
jgi:hypothetical protein